MGDILNVAGSIKHDNSIIKKEYHTYTPYTQSFNNNDEIRIAIQSQDLYVLPSESYVYMEVSVRVHEGAPVFAFGYGGFFFSEIRYELNGVEIDRCKSPGITMNLKRNMASRPNNLYNLVRQYENQTVATRGYRFIIPLNTIFGFADDYRKILMNAKHELILIRNRSDEHVHNSPAAAVTFTVTKVNWKIPHIQLSDHAKLSMLRYLERKSTISIPYRSWELYELPSLPQATKHMWTDSK